MRILRLLLDPYFLPFKLWRYACFLGLLFCVATRASYYSFASLPEPLDTIVPQALWAQFGLMLAFIILINIWIIEAGIVVACTLLKRSWVIRKHEERWMVSGWVDAVLWSLLLVSNFILDGSPYFALIGWPTLVFWGFRHPWLSRLMSYRAPNVVLALGFVSYSIWGLFQANHILELLIGGFWFISFGAILWKAASYIKFKEGLLTGVIGIGVLHLLLIVASSYTNFHGGKLLGESLAYYFCETPDQERLYVSVPHCGGFEPACQDGRIHEYDLDSLELLKEYSFFDKDFYGRAEQVVCLEDRIQVMLTDSFFDQTNRGRFNMFEFSLEEEPYFTEAFPDDVGPRGIYMPSQNSIYYIGDSLIHYNLDTLEQDNLTEQLTLGEEGGFFIAERYSVDSRTGDIWIAECITGSRLYRLDTSTNQVTHVGNLSNGGAIAVTVDEELDRLYVSGMFGFEVLDLKTQEVIMRKRTGLASRMTVIDSTHDLLYISSTVGGNIWVLDRHSLETLGSIPVGFGTRHQHITSNGKYFIGSSQKGFFYWDAAELAQRFKPL